MTGYQKGLQHAAWVSVLCLFAYSLGCGDVEPDGDEASESVESYVEYSDEYDADHTGDHQLVIDAGDIDEWSVGDGVIELEYGETFRQIGLMMAADAVDAMEYRSRIDGEWTEWKTLDVYFSEGRLHNAHVIAEEGADRLQWRGIEGLESAQVTFSDEVTARSEIIGAQDDVDSPPETGDGDDIDSLSQAVAPSSMVTSRSDWQATDPGKVCGNVVAPYRMTIHHTYSPSDDGGDAALRMRQMQSYHINTNGWCDIGYHFVVAQSGEIFQGRSHSDRPAAHVGGENSGNVGISMIGDYTTSGPPQIQLDGVVDMVAWVHDEHGVDIDDDAIKGHREWPGQSTQCPGDSGLAELDDIIADAADEVADDSSGDDSGSGGDDDGSGGGDSGDGADDDDGGSGGSSSGLPDDGDNVDVNGGCGCSATSGDSSSPPTNVLLVMVVLGALAIRNRRTR